jgi:ATP-binding cassette subfamily B (MDR/TAP) protein 1
MLVTSGLYAASQSVVYLCAALAFWYGGTLIADREYSAFQVYVCFVCLISGSQIAGSIFNFAPDAGKAVTAAYELQRIIELKNTRDSKPGPLQDQKYSVEYEKREQELFRGHNPWRVSFRVVSFIYPSRPDTCALSHFSIAIERGQTLALVGQSGSGKSTCLSLLTRFYMFDQGQIQVDGHDIRDLDLSAYRSAICLISQEPIIFTGTIRENIAVGLVGQEIHDSEILAACQQANIIEFVKSLP